MIDHNPTEILKRLYEDEAPYIRLSLTLRQNIPDVYEHHRLCQPINSEKLDGFVSSLIDTELDVGIVLVKVKWKLKDGDLTDESAIRNWYEKKGFSRFYREEKCSTALMFLQRDKENVFPALGSIHQMYGELIPCYVGAPEYRFNLHNLDNVEAETVGISELKAKQDELESLLEEVLQSSSRSSK